MLTIDEMAFQRVAKCLYANNALKIDFDNHYVLGDGIKSPLYIDGGALISDVSSRVRISDSVTFWINQFNSDIDAIVAVASGGIAFASAAANSKLVPLLYASTKPKDHGLFNQIVGDLPKDGAKVVVIDNVIKTGKSALSVVEALRRGVNGKKADVVGVYGVFDWDLPSGNNLFKECNVEKHSLVTVKSLIAYGIEQNFLDKETASRLIDYYHTLP